MINNFRHISVRKKTASRIAAIQILYIYNFNKESIENSANIFLNNYKLNKVLKNIFLVLIIFSNIINNLNQSNLNLIRI